MSSYRTARVRKALFEAIATLDSRNEVAAFLEDLCTPAELEAMIDRWTVVPYLQKGSSYREIHKLTGVSLVTIGRVAKALQFGAGGYQLLLDRLASERGSH